MKNKMEDLLYYKEQLNNSLILTDKVKKDAIEYLMTFDKVSEQYMESVMDDLNLLGYYQCFYEQKSAELNKELKEN